MVCSCVLMCVVCEVVFFYALHVYVFKKSFKQNTSYSNIENMHTHEHSCMGSERRRIVHLKA